MTTENPPNTGLLGRAVQMTGRRFAYRLEKTGQRWILSIYAVHDDGGPYCLTWDRIPAKDLKAVREDLARRGVPEMEGEG